MELTQFLLMPELQYKHSVAVEKEDQGDTDKTVTETITLAKVGDVAAEKGTVPFSWSSDYDVLYDTNGANPSSF